jgi:DNA polymerase III subunit delta'
VSFDAIQDQTVAVKLLTKIVASHRVPAGMLLWGPAGVGKRMAALEFVMALNCENPGDGACGECLPCRKSRHGNHPDIRTVTPADKTREIKTAAIDEVNELAALRPFEAKRRAFLFEDADRMNVSAQNHFLKTLEEPPGPSVFLLITAFPRQLLPTIRSRCQPIRFGALRPETVAAILERERGVSGEQAAAIARLSEGQMSRAFDLVDTDKRGVVMDLVASLRQGESPMRVADVFKHHLDELKKALEQEIKQREKHDPAEMSKEDRERQAEQDNALLQAAFKQSVDDYLYLFETWYRDELVMQAGAGPDRVWNQDRLDALQSPPAGDIAARIAAIEQARTYLERYVNEDRVFRHLFVQLAPSGTEV